MPSDSKKKRAEAKKNLAKTRGQKKPQNGKESGSDDEEPKTNGHTNGLSNGTNGTSTPKGMVYVDSSANLSEVLSKLEKVELENSKSRAVAGTLTSHPRARDTQISGLTVTFYGVEIVADTVLELNMGRRYGIIGLNGSGKTCLMQAMARREIPIPDHIDLFLLSREIAASDKTALQSVVEVDAERASLETEAESLIMAEDDESQERLMDIYERLDALGADQAEVQAAELLFGLGFTPNMQNKACKDFSGGWRMRIALARALYLKPSLLLLDEPTNHLDLDACVWLEQELAHYKRCLVMVSHSQDFMNGVCTNIIHLFQGKLNYYGGNYDTFCRTRAEQLENQAKQYKREQDQISHMKEYVARFGHGSAKLARQAQSKEKTMKKMIDGGLTEKVATEHVKQFYFNDPGLIPPPVIMVQHVAFRYNDVTPYIYTDLDFGVDLQTRIALVGPNGAGKSTLLKLLTGELVPTDGLIRRHSHVSLGLYHQHLAEQLDLELSALEYMQKSYPNIVEREQMRKIIGRYGLTGRQQTCPMKQLSDGQRCRVSFAWLAQQNPHLLLLDEPTNHLDLESIDALAEAINDYPGGLILVSHDFRLVSQVSSEIWVCEHQKVTKWEGDIFSYKEFLRKRIEKAAKKRAAMGK